MQTIQPEPFVVELVKKQAEEGLSVRAFARKLGVNGGYWSRVRRGIEPAGRKVIVAGCRSYPYLAYFVGQVSEISDSHSARTQVEGAA